ncbi:MAG: flocculation-associated PEP-CTERM protein PepA [Azoarcus sp.]|nr:flocculation-associated PEP-CTERM protein PepA [Azoarcus sp.]
MLESLEQQRTAHWIGALALALLPQVALAAPVWQINTEGTGLSGASTVSSVDVTGVGFVQILPSTTVPYVFDFVEHGAYRAVKPDGLAALGTHDLTLTYSVFGTGSFLDPAALRFTSGTIDIYADAALDFGTATANYGADNGTLIARLGISEGGVDAAGLVTVKASAIQGTLRPGYFFTADGSDLSTRNDVTMTLGVYNQTVTPDAMMISEVICSLAAYAGPGCNGEPYANTPLSFAVQDGGYAFMSTVAEPGSLSMLLAGLGLVATVRRRRRAAH